jgi:hypothetical protein
MEAAGYNLHRDMLGIPSYIGSVLVGLALGYWLIGLVLMIACLFPYHRIYRAYFSDAKHHPRRASVATNAIFIVAQLAVWGFAFFASIIIRDAWRAI